MFFLKDAERKTHDQTADNVARLPDEARAVVGTVSFPHMGYEPAGPLGLPPGVPQQALHFASVSPTQHDAKLQSAASALTAQAHVFLLS